LNLSERVSHADAYAFHQDLLRLRREDPVIRAQSRDSLDGAVLGPHTFVLRFFGRDGDDRLLAVNLGADFEYDPAPEPLLAPPAERSWQQVWSSDAPRYGGPGVIPACRAEGWRFPGHSAAFFSTVSGGRQSTNQK
jgi:maltooligosyltrehalose trehalohydrolase